MVVDAASHGRVGHGHVPAEGMARLLGSRAIPYRVRRADSPDDRRQQTCPAQSLGVFPVTVDDGSTVTGNASIHL